MGNSYRVRIGLKEIAAMEPNTILTFSLVYRNKENVQRWQKLEALPYPDSAPCQTGGHPRPTG